MSDRLWSYREITDTAAAEIAALMEAGYGRERARRDLFAQWAVGIYKGWQSITSGSQEEGDAERLLALTDLKRW
ncbi:hypothetical protein N0A02_33100 (plasmid) [Paraburkholderia acidicola]|uniref:Uncharacterized protein n=1 Tax=Paraburkholderia acidicola TaxID=1912599 RepID=A0ABV1M054_9BURK